MSTYKQSNLNLQKVLDVNEKFRLIRQAVATLEKHQVEFDVIACCGVNGIVFGTSLADRLQLPIVIVRKQETKTPHSWNEVEGPDYDESCHAHLAAKRFLFVDDLIQSGATYEWVMQGMHRRYPTWRLSAMLMFDYDYGSFEAIEKAMQAKVPLFHADRILYHPEQ